MTSAVKPAVIAAIKSVTSMAPVSAAPVSSTHFVMRSFIGRLPGVACY